MFKRNKYHDKELSRMTDEELESLSLAELQRIRNKRWANQAKELEKRANDELKRRSPKANWSCEKCGRTKFHEREIRVAGSFFKSFLGWEMQKYHAIICNYCGKTEFYNVMMSGSEKTLGFFGD